MSRAINAIVIGIAVFVLLTGSIWYVMVAREPNRITASIDREWTSETGDNFTAVATFKNPYDYEVILLRYDYKFLVNGDEFDGGGDAPEETIEPGRSTHVELRVAFPVGAVSGWLKAHVANDETSTVQLRGEAIFSLSDRNATVPFGYTETFSTHILKDLTDGADCRGAKGVCFAGADAQWAQKNNAVLLVVEADLHNPTDQRAELGNSSLSLFWSGVEVAKGVTEGGSIDPDDDLGTEFLLFFDHQKLITWWGAHTGRCEESPSEARLVIEADYEDAEEPKASESPSPNTSNTTGPSNSTASPTSSSSSPSSTSSSPSPSPSDSPTDEPDTIRESQNVHALAEPGRPLVLEFDAVQTAFVCKPE